MFRNYHKATAKYGMKFAYGKSDTHFYKKVILFFYKYGNISLRKKILITEEE